MKKKRKQHEADLQKAVIKYMKLQHPSIFINGSMGGTYLKYQSQRVKAKLCGYKKGFPDLFIYEPRMIDGIIYHGLAIELKVKGNYASQVQKRTLEDLKERNYKTFVCTGIDHTLEVIEWYLTTTFPEVDIDYTIKE
jgi:hypothetical protein|tara:strand:+ start:12158 stop:12568 length:411 start_codon:yes stop_codon:yes gene_type:complete